MTVDAHDVVVVDANVDVGAKVTVVVVHDYVSAFVQSTRVLCRLDISVCQ